MNIINAKRLHQTSEISSIYIHDNPTNRKKIGNLEKVPKKEPQDSFSTTTQTEHLAVLLQW